MLERNTVISYRPVTNVLLQHVADAAILWQQREDLAKSPHANLRRLGRFDERLESHLDGLAVAGESAWPLLEQTLELPTRGRMFVIAVNAIKSCQISQLERLFALSEAMPEIRSGLSSAFGWVQMQELRGIVVNLLQSGDPLRRAVAVAASAMHRVDPGLATGGYLEDQHPLVRARAYRALGELGGQSLLPRAHRGLTDDDATCKCWAAWASTILGSADRARDVLAVVAKEPSPQRTQVFRLVLQSMGVRDAHSWLKTLAADAIDPCWLIRGAGIAGDPAYIPWLIGHMNNDLLARIAGEALSLITGLDLAWLDLERKPPENLESSPNNDPNDPNVAMDDDDGLPWPDQSLIQSWWRANSHRFQAGVRYFMGEPLNRENCVRVLKEGFQRQRIAAALYLSLLNPGTPLFEWRAPARRQQALLAQMS